MFTDIKNSDQFETVQKVAKGWSSDEKYFIQTREQQRLLLRVSDVAHSSLYSIKWAEKFD
jgi:aminoglycoside phosphotransferase (APT) family kinase protein